MLPRGRALTLASFRAGLKEANDVVLHLKPLRILLEEMDQADFSSVG